ncbi:MAG TPA: HlyD family efflux transporter periplasmic adaptor subunit [Phycisphaerae bacterium]|nr:HlyD family efflux transporter periplasmic adaptor subunit [Phycisphaerae bacterium]
MRKKIFIVLLVLIIGGVVAAGWWWKTFYLSQDRTHTVSRGDIISKVIISGKVDYKQSTDISSEVSATIKSWHVDENSVVKAGQVLVELDDGLVTEDLAKANAMLADAQAHLKDLQSGARKEEKEKAFHAVTLAEAEFNLASKRFDEIKQMKADKVISASEIDSRTTALDVARARLDAARSGKNLIEAGTRKEQVNQAEAKVNLAQAQVNRCQVLLKKYVMTAEYPGVITARHFNVGELVSPGTILLKLLGNTDPKTIEIRGYAQESELAQIKTGQIAQVESEAFPGNPFTAVITGVVPQVDRELGTVPVLLSLSEDVSADLARALFVNRGTVDIALTTGEVRDVIRVPIDAVEGSGEKAALWVRQGWGFERRKVTTGLSAGRWIEITDGLEDGEVIRLR